MGDAPKLKDFFDRKVVEELSDRIGGAYPRLDRSRFVRDCLTGLDRLELTARGWHLAEVLRQHLPDDFEQAAAILIDSLGPELDRTDEFGMAPFRYLPHVFYVAKYGLEHFETAMRAQYELTKRFSAEYSIRGFLVRHPRATYARLEEWARDPNPHVRRLVSEGSRPRLPWAPRLKAFQDDPQPVLALLDALKDDPELYVRRSVANNLNDIGKDHPALLVDVCRRWSAGAGPDRKWLIRHALRSLVKKGHPGALAVVGFAGAPKVRVTAAALSPRQPRIGGRLDFSIDVVSAGARSQNLLVDYVVHFVKANGKTAPKVFKLKEIVLAPARACLTRRSGVVRRDDHPTSISRRAPPGPAGQRRRLPDRSGPRQGVTPAGPRSMRAMRSACAGCNAASSSPWASSKSANSKPGATVQPNRQCDAPATSSTPNHVPAGITS